SGSSRFIRFSWKYALTRSRSARLRSALTSTMSSQTRRSARLPVETVPTPTAVTLGPITWPGRWSVKRVTPHGFSGRSPGKTSGRRSLCVTASRRKRLRSTARASEAQTTLTRRPGRWPSSQRMRMQTCTLLPWSRGNSTRARGWRPRNACSSRCSAAWHSGRPSGSVKQKAANSSTDSRARLTSPRRYDRAGLRRSFSQLLFQVGTDLGIGLALQVGDDRHPLLGQRGRAGGAPQVHEDVAGVGAQELGRVLPQLGVLFPQHLPQTRHRLLARHLHQQGLLLQVQSLPDLGVKVHPAAAGAARAVDLQAGRFPGLAPAPHSAPP